MPTILLIGANGQLGSELAESLKPHGKIVATVRRCPAALAGANARVLEMTEPEQLRQVIREVRPNLIVNAAAYTNVDAAQRDRELAIAVNCNAPALLAEEAARLGAALVHYSTDYVFDGTGHQSWREEDRANPLNWYGETKRAGEEAIRSWGAAHLIIRSSWIYGAKGQNFVKKMLRLAAERDEISVVSDQIGAPTSARFVANVTANIIGQSRGEPRFFRTHGGTLHVACAGETSWHGFAEAIFHHASVLEPARSRPRVRPIASTEYPSPAQRPLNSRLDTTRLTQRFSVIAPSWQAELAAILPTLYAEVRRETTGRTARAA